jgi:hypothetical protein
MRRFLLGPIVVPIEWMDEFELLIPSTRRVGALNATEAL